MRPTVKNSTLSLAVALALSLGQIAPAFAQSQPYPGGGTAAGGSGDFSGPASSTADDFVQFSGTGGKTGKDGAYSPASFSPAGVVLDAAVSVAIHAADVAACKMYRVTAASVVFTFDAVSTPLGANGCIEVATGANSATATGNAADTVSFAGVTSAAGGSAVLPAYGLYRITIKTGNLDIAGATAQGNGAKLVHATGAFTTGNTVKIDANGNVIDAGSAPGGGSMTVATGRWFPFQKGTTATGVNITATKMVLVAHYFPLSTAITQLGINVSGASAGNAQLSLYGSGTDNLPLGAPLCSTPATLNTGVSTNVAGNCAATVQGMVWCGAQLDNATATFKSYTSGSWGSGDIGSTSQSNFGNNTTTEGTEYSVGSLTFGTPPTISTVTEAGQGSNTVPACRFKT